MRAQALRKPGLLGPHPHVNKQSKREKRSFGEVVADFLVWARVLSPVVRIEDVDPAMAELIRRRDKMRKEHRKVVPVEREIYARTHAHLFRGRAPSLTSDRSATLNGAAQ